MKKRFLFVLILVFGLVTDITKADFTFGEPINMGPTVNTSAHDITPRLPADGLSLYFSSNRPGGFGENDLWITTRPTTSDPWGIPVNLGPTVNSSDTDYSLSISADDRTLYFASTRAGGSGGHDLWVTTRPTKNDPWSIPVNLGSTVNSSADEFGLGISGDSLSLYFTSNREGGYGGYDVWVTTRSSTNNPWGMPVNLGPTVNSSAEEYTLGISADTQTLYIATTRPGGSGWINIWVTRQTSINDDWSEPVNLGPEVNSLNINGFPHISADGQMLYLSSNRPGGTGGVDLWQIPIIPVVDFNGDGIVDSADMCILVDYWGMNESLCDIAPMPWGDGVVDAQDMVMLAEHLFEEYPPVEPAE